MQVSDKESIALYINIPWIEDEGEVGPLVSTLSLFAKGSKSVSAVILQKKATHEI